MNFGEFRRLEFLILDIFRILSMQLTISGSFALYLLGLLKPGRKVKDLDLVFDYHDMKTVLERLHAAGIIFYQCNYSVKDTDSIYFYFEMGEHKVDLIFKKTVNVCYSDTITMDNSMKELYKFIVIEDKKFNVHLNPEHHMVESMDFKLEGLTLQCLIHNPNDIIEAKIKVVKENNIPSADLLQDNPKRHKVMKHLMDILHFRKVMKERNNKDVYSIINNEGQRMGIECQVEIDGVTNIFKNVPVQIVEKDKPKPNNLTFSVDEENKEIPWQD